jgi:hypothetical protein
MATICTAVAVVTARSEPSAEKHIP